MGLTILGIVTQGLQSGVIANHTWEINEVKTVQIQKSWSDRNTIIRDSSDALTATLKVHAPRHGGDSAQINTRPRPRTWFCVGKRFSRSLLTFPVPVTKQTRVKNKMTSTNDRSKNEFVVAIQEVWSPTINETFPHDMDPQSFVETKDHGDVSYTHRDFADALLMHDSVNSTEFMITEELYDEDTGFMSEFCKYDRPSVGWNKRGRKFYSESEKYQKAQTDLHRLFMQDQEESKDCGDDEDDANQFKNETQNNCANLTAKMRLAGLEWISEGGDVYTSTSGAARNGQRKFSGTTTLNSIMSIQTLSIGSSHALSVTSLGSMCGAVSLLRAGSGEVSCLGMEYDLDVKKTTPDAAGREQTKTDTDDDSEEMDMETTNEPAPEFAANAPFIHSDEPDVIKAYFAVMGDRSARGPRLTAGTKELRNTKEWYKENRAAYQRSGRQGELFPDAMARYYKKMSELYVDFPADQAAREKTFLMYCSKAALASGRVETPNCYRHAKDKECLYGTAKFTESVLFYFNARDPPKLENLVTRYRGLLEARPNLSGDRRDYFERYLEFCEMTLEKASNGCATAQLATERNNFIPTLRCLWEDIEASMSCK